MTQNADRVLAGAWWRAHPAYRAIVESFQCQRINNAQQLAFVLLAGLRERGFDVTQNDSAGAQS